MQIVAVVFAIIMLMGCFFPWLVLRVEYQFIGQQTGIEFRYGIALLFIGIAAIVVGLLNIIRKKSQLCWAYFVLGIFGLLSCGLFISSVQGMQQSMIHKFSSSDYSKYLSDVKGISLGDMLGTGVTISLVGSFCLLLWGLVVLVPKHSLQDNNVSKPNAYQQGYSRKQIFGILGVILIVIGCFLPIVQLPIIGNINYFRNGSGDGLILLLLSIIALPLLLLRKYFAILLVGICSTCLLFYTTFNFLITLSDVKERMHASLSDNPFQALGTTLMESAQLQWGWAVLLLGCAFLVIAGVMRSKSENYSTRPDP